MHISIPFKNGYHGNSFFLKIKKLKIKNFQIIRRNWSLCKQVLLVNNNMKLMASSFVNIYKLHKFKLPFIF